MKAKNEQKWPKRVIGHSARILWARPSNTSSNVGSWDFYLVRGNGNTDANYNQYHLRKSHVCGDIVKGWIKDLVWYCVYVWDYQERLGERLVNTNFLTYSAKFILFVGFNLNDTFYNANVLEWKLKMSGSGPRESLDIVLGSYEQGQATHLVM